jgi:hypothetical protein
MPGHPRYQPSAQEGSVSADNHIHQDHASTADDPTGPPPEVTANPAAGAHRQPPDVSVIREVLGPYSVTRATALIFRFLRHTGEEPYPVYCPDCGFAVECDSGCEDQTYQLVSRLRELVWEVHFLLAMISRPDDIVHLWPDGRSGRRPPPPRRPRPGPGPPSVVLTSPVLATSPGEGCCSNYGCRTSRGAHPQPPAARPPGRGRRASPGGSPG